MDDTPEMVRGITTPGLTPGRPIDLFLITDSKATRRFIGNEYCIAHLTAGRTFGFWSLPPSGASAGRA
jgi:hypothetical protein